MSVDLGPLTHPKPITPEEAKERNAKALPGFIILAVNELLTEHYSLPIVLRHHDLRGAVEEVTPPSVEPQDWWWDALQNAYEAAGWIVEFERPDHGDSGGSIWRFRPKKK